MVRQAHKKSWSSRASSSSSGRASRRPRSRATTSSCVRAQQKDDQTHDVTGDRVLVCVGRRPFSDGLGLADVGVAVDNRGRVTIDDEYQTNVGGIFAIGDVTRGAMLAHKAEDEGIAVAEILAGGHGHVNYDAIPSIVYTHPEVAGMGKTEEELVAANIPFVKGRLANYGPNGRAWRWARRTASSRCSRTRRRTACSAATSSAPGPGTSSPRSRSRSSSVPRRRTSRAGACHAHPTLSEVVREAALDCARRAIHK